MDRVKKDIDTILEEKALFTPLSGKVVLVTGATGLIGSMVVKSLCAANLRYGLQIRVIGQIRDEKKAEQVFGELYGNISFTRSSGTVCDFIIHTASPTASKYFVEHPVETIKASVESTIEVLETARECGASVVYLSSMEQYGVPYEPGQRMTEDKVGIIDHLSVRSSYSEAKRLCECLCASYATEYGVDVKIARLAQTFGAGVPLTDNRMPIQFARSVVRDEDIVLHTEGRSKINFVYLTDAITGILTILVKGSKGEAYNVCNDTETRSVREIAETVCGEVAGGAISVRTEIKENMGYAPDVSMYLDSGKLNSIGWQPRVDIKSAYERLVDYLLEQEGRTSGTV